MIELEVIVDYNVILTHFVDTLSCWDYHVEKYVREYVEREYGITGKDEQLLKAFVEIRKPLGWKNETELFDWAHKGYPDNAKFNELLPIIKHFENKKSLAQMTISSYLESKTQLIKANGYESVSTAFAEKYETYIHRLTKLFASKVYEKPLPCYLTYSPDEKWTMGGANGEGICIELKDSEIKDGRILDDVILHEFLHKRVSPHSYYETNNKEISQRRDARADNFGYPDLYTSLIEEAIVYAICDIVRYNKKTPTDKIQFFNENRRPEMVALWTVVRDITPVLREYLLEEAEEEQTRKQLTKYFVQKLREIPK